MKQQPSNIAYMFMKKNILLFSFLLFLLLSQTTIYSQNNKPLFVGVSYLKTNPGKFNDYKNLLKMYSKKATNYSIEQGQILGWYANEVLMPVGNSAEYDIAVVIITHNLNTLLEETISFNDLYKKAFPDGNDAQRDSILKSFRETRTLVKKDIFVFNSSLNMNNDTLPTYVQVDFMKPAKGKYAQYIKMEKETFLPIHKERVKLGALADWGLYEKFLPYSDDAEYTFITTNFYNNLNALTDNRYMEAYKKAFPTGDINKLMPTIETTRKLVKSEIWKLIDYTEAPRK